MSKRLTCKSFMCYHFLAIHKILVRQKLVSFSCSKHPKIIEIKNDKTFIFTPLFAILERFYEDWQVFLKLFWGTKSVKIKQITHVWGRWSTPQNFLWHLLMNIEKPKKSNFWKNIKKCWRYHHFTHVYQKP